MYVRSVNAKSKAYYSCSTDSVIHYMKEFRYDLYSLDRITDVFYKSKTLTLTVKDMPTSTAQLQS